MSHAGIHGMLDAESLLSCGKQDVHTYTANAATASSYAASVMVSKAEIRNGGKEHE